MLDFAYGFGFMWIEDLPTSSVVFYIIWALFPILLVGMALWAKLERVSGSPKKQDPIDFLKQCGFVLLCVAVAVLIDYFLLVPYAEGFLPDFVPLGFVQLLLLPFILYLLALVIGPTKPARITKAPVTRSRKQQPGNK